MPVPGKGHKDIRQDQESYRISCFHLIKHFRIAFTFVLRWAIKIRTFTISKFHSASYQPLYHSTWIRQVFFIMDDDTINYFSFGNNLHLIPLYHYYIPANSTLHKVYEDAINKVC